MDEAERIVGSVLGLALGDALGAPFELRRSRHVPDPIRGGYDPDDLVARHIAWLAGNPRDVGNLTHASCAASRPALRRQRLGPAQPRARSGSTAVPRRPPATAR